MNVVIIEDEKLAAGHLESLILKYDNKIKIVQQIDSVKKSIKWFEQNPLYDLIFMDIQLADGLCFEIFDQVKLNTPVIFTTAYDQYAIKAFKVNSIDYLLKPIDYDDLKSAIEKFNSIRSQTPYLGNESETLGKVLKILSNNFKSRFLVKVGEHLRFINIEEISYFISLERSTFIQIFGNNHSYAVDYSLDDIENIIDPAKFFRINRKYIVSLSSIVDIVSFSSSRLKLKLKNCADDDLIVSREKVSDFKKWLEGS